MGDQLDKKRAHGSSVSCMNVVPARKSSKWVTYLSIENSNWVSTSAERTPKAVSSGAEAAKCVSGVETKSLFLIYFTFDENFMWIVDLFDVCKLLQVDTL